MNHGLLLRPCNDLSVIGFSDVDWGSELNGR